MLEENKVNSELSTDKMGIENVVDLTEEERLKGLFKNNPEAMQAYKILKHTDRSVFLTGKAGTGKSTFIKLAKSIFTSVSVVCI